ncbi:MAG: tetratricopeptide repeat protein, partial [Dysgonamonadaceae bacterium]|nr:tetratricopeptide repeat protein [Dysgonamonadaceae bacterium]
MKTVLLAYSFILSSSLLFAQNKQNDVELLRQSSEIIFNNAVSSADIAVLKQASAVVPEILPIAQAFENRAFDKNQAKHIAALKAIAEKIGKDGEENSIAYIQSLFYLADYYYGTSDYDNAQKLFGNALNLLEKLPYSEQKTQSHIKTQWHFLLEYKIISSKDFGHETADWVLLENWLSEATSYIDGYSGADTYEMMYLCLYIVWAGNTFDFPFSDLEHYYQKGLSIANSTYKDWYEINAYYSQVFADYQAKNGSLDAAEKIYSDNLKRSEELYGNINYYKTIFLSRLADIDVHRGDLASAVQKQKECIRLDNILNDNSNLYLLNSLVAFLLEQGSEGRVEAEQYVKEAVEKSKKTFGEISNQHISALQHQIEFYQQTGDVAAERECLKKIHNIALETANKKPLDAVIMLKNISENYEHINAYSEVIAILDDAIKILKEKLKIRENPIDYADILSRQSQIYLKKGLYNKAQTLAEEAAKILSKADNKLFYAVALQNLADIYNKEQQSKEALKQIKSAYQICRTNQLENNETFVYILLWYAKILQNNNDIEASEDKLKEAITIAGQLPNNALLSGMCYQAYGDFFYDANKLESTLTQFKKAEQQYQKCGDNGTVKYLELLQNMGSVYADMGKLDSAR